MARINHEKRNRLDKLSRPHSKTPTSSYKKKSPKRGASMKAKFPGTCISCNKRFEKDQNIYYYFDIKKAKHSGCKKPDWM